MALLPSSLESLVTSSLMPYFLKWKYVCDELNATINETTTALSTGRGVTLLTCKQKNLDRVISRYERQWEDFSSQLLKASVSLDEFYKTHISFSKEASAVQDRLSEGIDQITSSPHVHASAPLKLPQITLPEFSGNVEDWTQFWGLFTSLVDSRGDLPVSVKFTYLKNSLHGPSAKLVAGFAVNDSNYQQAKDLLVQEYQNKDRCVRQLTRKIIGLKNPKHDFKELFDFRASYNQLIRSLRAYKDMSAISWFLCEQLLYKLSEQTQIFMYQHLKSQYFSFDEFDGALEVLIQLLESKTASKTVDHVSRVVRTETPKKSQVSWSAMNPGSSSSRVTCVFCDQGHYANKCPTYVTVEQRRSALRNKNLCLRCSHKGHYANACGAKLNCFLCKGNHWVGLCTKTSKPNTSAKPKSPSHSSTSTETTTTTHKASAETSAPAPKAKSETETVTNKRLVTQISSNNKGGVALPTAIFKVYSKSKGGSAASVRCFFDSGSQKSYIHPEVLERLGIVPEDHTTISLAAFGHDVETVSCPIVKVKLSLGNRVAAIQLLVTDRVQMELYAPGLKETIAMLKKNKVRLADCDASDKLNDIAIVLGADTMPKFIRGTLKVGSVNLFDSPGGCIVYGSLPFGESSSSTVNQSVCCARVTVQNCDVDTAQVFEVPPPEVSKLWELDAIGIKDEKFTPGEQRALQKFADSIKYQNGKYWVRLPWKQEPEILPTNYRTAIGQYNSLIRGLQGNSTKFDHYDKVIQEYLSNDFIEEVTEPTVRGHYLPHHPVFKQSATTPLRVVFNASSKAGDNLSLNDVLETGPSLTEKLVDSLLTFRMGEYGVIADISKAFLRVGLQEVDRDFVRFLWSSDPLAEPKTYRFKAVLFGSTSSPFLLQATLYKHFQESPSVVKDILAKSFYVDNFQATVDNEEDLYLLQKEASECLRKANFPLQEWNSNSVNFNEFMDDPERKVCPSVLGVCWNTNTDELSIKPVEIEQISSLTKRRALAFFSSLYDPLGLLSPISVKGKLFIRQLWVDKMGWDEPLDQSFIDEFNGLALEYEEIPMLRFPRCVGPQQGQVQLHVFCDASARAYGAVAYVCVDGRSLILMSKARVAPLKTRSIPQLELTALLLGCRMVKYIVELLSCTFEIHVWSDNAPCLFWVKNERSNIVYVKNRVSEIVNLKNKFDITLHHIDTKSNPADILSRGCSVNQLCRSDLWFKGPPWLGDKSQWPTEVTPVTSFEIVTQDVSVPVPDSIFPVDRYSYLRKLLNITNKVFSFLHIVSKGRINTPDSLIYWLKMEQKHHYGLVYEALQLRSHENKYAESRRFICDLSLFLDEDGVIRSCGRLDRGSPQCKFNNPVLLPPKSFLCGLIIRDIHNKHYHRGVQETLNEIRDRYWVPKGRQAVRNIVKNCIVCRYDVRKAFVYPGPPPLPPERVQYTDPFEYCGVDFTGALKIKANDDSVKFYVCLFTCTATRAIHLELVESLSAESFILCLHRFAARCSLPKCFISDNATNFVATNRFLLKLSKHKDVQVYLESRQIKWKFISPRAPWQGGFYERLIGIVKSCLQKALHKRQVSPVELSTILTEVEAIVNNRPLVYLDNDVKSERALTPAHLLYGRKIRLYPNLEVTVEPEELTNNVEVLLAYHHHITFVINKFKRLWATEYLQSLREKHYSPRQSDIRRPIEGEVVILGLDSTRDKWELGRILELLPGADGQVREVIVQNKGQLLRKTVEKLIPLEISPVEQPVLEGNVSEVSLQDLDLDGSEDNSLNTVDPQVPDLSCEAPSVRPMRRAAQDARRFVKGLIEENLL